MKTCTKIFISVMALVAPVAANAMTIKADISGFNVADPDWAVLGIAPVSAATFWVTFDETAPTITNTVGAPNFVTDTAFYAITDFKLEFGSLTLDGFVSGPDFSTAYARDTHDVVNGPPPSDMISFDIYEDQALPGGVVFDAFHLQMINPDTDTGSFSGVDFGDLDAINAMLFQNAYIRFYLPEDPGATYAIGAFRGTSFTLTDVTAVPVPATAPLALGSIGILAALGWRRKTGTKA